MPDNKDESGKIGQRWVAVCRDALDGSGDLLVELPADLMLEAGWAVGDELAIEIVGQSIVLSRQKSSLP